MKRIASIVSATILLLVGVGGPAGATPAGAAPAGARAPAAVQAPAAVSPAWLAAHAGRPNLVVVDIRTAGEYAEGHIASAVNMPFEVPLSDWITMRDDLLLELPDAPDLAAALGAHGISRHCLVVVVGSVGQPPFPQAGATRVAVTLSAAGIRRVRILDGGHPGWVAQGRAVTTEVPEVEPVTFDGTLDGTLDGAAFVDMDYVADHLGEFILVDGRDADVYAGLVTEPWAPVAGHIPTAVSLPAPLIWNDAGTFRSRAELSGLVRAALGDPRRDTEIIVYCGVGGYASSWLFVLTRMLGFRHVRMYDGSAQEWVLHHGMELAR